VRATTDESGRSRAYDTVGQTLDYVDEVAGNTLTIWAGERGSPAHYKGELSDDGNSFPAPGFTLTAAVTPPRCSATR